MAQGTFESFKEKLDQLDWPQDFMFKFIVNSADAQKVAAIFPEGRIKENPSRNGKYVSVTIEQIMPDSTSVINKYKEVGEKVEVKMAL